MIINDLQDIVQKNRDQTSALFLRNLLKEALQIYTLNFIYGSTYGEKFLFKGGTCLRFCFGLPRLSEDLDFDIKNYQDFSVEKFRDDVVNYFTKQLQYKEIETKIAGSKKQIFLKFPVMSQLGLAKDKSKSNVLFLRIDLNRIASGIFQEEVSLYGGYDFNFIIKRYSLADLFASKIAAILQRTFRKGKKDSITFKGRDYFDLIWFLEKGVPPNFERVKDIVDIQKRKDILEKLDNRVEKVKEEYLKEDLLPLFSDEKFINNFVKNFKNLYKDKIRNIR